jgi:V/A-type H+-transporting ATPase subunit D
MAKIKLTKNEQKKQKDSLKRFSRYLPTLMLKKQQLQMVIRKVEQDIAEKQKERDSTFNRLAGWLAVFSEKYPLAEHINIESVETDIGNIAGVDIPVYRNLSVSIKPYNLYFAPLWVDAGIGALKEMAVLDFQIRILGEQIRLLSDELRVTSQRVNLFEKVKIPEARENIRKINIYLGDQQTAAVVRGKIAKRNIVKEAKA